MANTGFAVKYTGVDPTTGSLSNAVQSVRKNISGVEQLSNHIRAHARLLNTMTMYCPYMNLPVAATVPGIRAFITDSPVTPAGNFGALATGGGTIVSPVYSDGVAWYIG